MSPDELVREIADRLIEEGRYVAHLESPQLQEVIDVGWAARQAGQHLGRPVRVSTSRSQDPGGRLTVTAVLLDPQPPVQA
jgi:hypothetical protein